MCIALFTTAHPDYALIAIDNRDEYILRPTSRPHWWPHPESGHEVLASRDQQRAEQGTWLGITREGYLAILTNYRETATPAMATTPISGVRSRGAMVKAWLGGLPKESVKDGVEQLVSNGGVQGVGGFSMVCTKLRKNGEGLAIVSNRAGDVEEVPLIARERGKVWGLSNAVYDERPGQEWPKVQLGKKLLLETVTQEAQASQEALVDKLFGVLDTDTLPRQSDDAPFEDYILQLRHSVFIPAIGDAAHRAAMAKGPGPVTERRKSLAAELRPDPTTAAALGFDTGLYGTQRQTVVLVDWEGEVTFVERALWDENGNEVPRGEGDVVFRFKIEGWEE
ncbi:NRDE protein-domain-containing protein [Stachybotrys elegans]|uniref:NRDE protein-domain-containing protein n=1 Tax=Stachybotrys elegans TaxID=80388 RepID=A0A8K0WPU1_9HYPO|nr:NRDE protein-domain-containing protein [Stachybotrys elegans]